MSESIVRKIQPFTIGTKLSVPSVAKCPDFVDAYLPSQALDNCKLQNSLNDQVSLYLGQSQMRQVTPRSSPTAAGVTAAEGRQEDMTREDHLNRNGVSPTGTSRSIRKITISGSTESPSDTAALGGDCMAALGTSKLENINNNNMVSTPVPRIVGVSCENTPNSHLKVLLRKDVLTEEQRNEDEGALKCFGDKTTSIHQTPPLRALSPKRDLLKKVSLPCENREAPSCSQLVLAHNDCSFTQCNTLFNREIMQAEAWIKRKLQDLKDGCDIQRCPLQDWEEVSQTLQRDLKDFENTLIQLNQMGEQLICEENPNSDLVKKQLTQLTDQWHTLKQTAANQSKALGGARNLQQFNRKVDRLETWIKEKEEEQSLAGVLGENVDKIQLTRRILDLKQDEQQYRTLHEEINHLALKLEKQGKTEGKNISTRRKHINKMWLKVQSLLKDYHENLQLALEVSSFYQQADNIISAINSKRKSISVSNDRGNCGDREIREIATQIMMLDVTVSQLSNLHPTLATRVTLKQGEVKDGWALLQKAVRNERSDILSASSDFTREDVDPLTLPKEPYCSMDKDVHRIMGKEIKEEQNRLKGCTSAREPGINRKSTNSQDEEQPLKSHAPVTGNSPSNADEVIEGRQTEGESKEQMTNPNAAASRGNPQLCVQLQKFTESADKMLSWLKDNTALATKLQCSPGHEGLQTALENEIPSNGTRSEAAEMDGQSLVHPEDVGFEGVLSRLELLWEEIRRKHQRNRAEHQDSKKLNLKALTVLKDLNALEAWLHTLGLSSQQSSLAGDTESMMEAEQDSCLLEEVPLQDPELGIVQWGADMLPGGRHIHFQKGVAEKYRRVRRALKQRGLGLQGTHMMTEALEKSKPGEDQEQQGNNHSSLGQHLPVEQDLDPSLSSVQEAGREVTAARTSREPMEERHAEAEMFKSTVIDSGCSLPQDFAMKELLSQCSALTMQINHGLSLSAELSMDIMDAETDMAVKCEPDRSGLEGLQEQQDELEIDYEALKEEVEELEKQATCLESLCPERLHILREEVQTTLQAWEELGRSMVENRGRLRQFVRLQEFFRNYLAMISWTEDTRACIFSESTGHHGNSNEVPVASDLDMNIQQKFEEFDDLAAAGQKLIEEEHHLTELIRERTEELQSMLGWILVHWRAQKHQRSHGKRKPEPEGNIHLEATVSTLPPQQPLEKAIAEGTRWNPDGQRGSTPRCEEERRGEHQAEDGHEAARSAGLSPPGGVAGTPKSPFLVLKEPGTPSLGGTVNLILSFSKPGDSLLQVQEPAEKGDALEPVHRVSTYLHVTDSNKVTASVDELSSLAHLPSQAQAPASRSSTSPSTCPAQVSSLSLHTLPRGSSVSSSSSFKGTSKNGGAIQRITGLAQNESVSPTHDQGARSTNTWPLKERKKKRTLPAGPATAELLDHSRNIPANDKECTRRSEFSQSVVHSSSCLSGEAPSKHIKNHCRHLSLGSVLSFDLPKDLSLIPSIQDVITISPLEPAGTDHLRKAVDLPDQMNQCLQPDRHISSSTFRHKHPPPKFSRETFEHSPKGQMVIKTDCVGSQRIDLEVSSDLAQCIPATNKEDFFRDHTQTPPADDLSDAEVRCHSDTGGPNNEVGQKQDQPTTALDPKEHLWSNGPKANPYKGHDHYKNTTCGHTSTLSVTHVCPSVHTKIQELNGHIYCPPVRMQRAHKGDCSANQSTASHTVMSLKTCVIGKESSGGVAACSSTHIQLSSGGQRTVSPDASLPGRTASTVSLGRVDPVSHAEEKVSHDLGSAAADTVHPDHRQFEEEEEELEDIWNQTNRYEPSSCSNNTCQTKREEPAATPPSQPTNPSPQGQDVLYRKLDPSSTSGLLVAEFRLPASIQTLLGYNKEQNPREESSPTREDGTSSAAIAHTEEPDGKLAVAKQAAPSLVKLPDAKNQQKYAGQEEVEMRMENTACPRVQSMSLLPVCTAAENPGQQPVGLGACNSDIREQGHRTATRGHCSTVNGKDRQFQSMEGTLERKHQLEVGKKAHCQAWHTCHAVLLGHTLRFYKDREDALKNSEPALSLDLIGATCTPAPECAKKANCFSLRLHDGSEHLLSVSSCPMMKEWMLKIQASAGVSDEMEPPRCLSGSLTTKAFFSTVCHGYNTCHCTTGSDITCSTPDPMETGSLIAKESTLTRDSPQVSQLHHGNSEDLSPILLSGAEDQCSSLRNVGMTQRPSPTLQGASPQSLEPPLLDSRECPSKRRSHSFTSATYQKITPVPLSHGGHESSSYSVTLFIGDQLSETTPPHNEAKSPTLIGQLREPLQDMIPEDNCACLPKSQKKSVFKKFFGKE
ncbi:hypothetical protein MATL_G00019460 [Megalops atlanticus]|uniref:PH domain-containing protein n=1 Tax=Megalops atlanticus TaxID=7932 RepID=A0A9D3TEP4_MEGAT|nr:hypothetical protein MATL_G00019460 [Megalops atlanticus]